MKSIIILLTISAIAVISHSCQQEYEPLDQFSDIMFVTSNGTINASLNPVIHVNQGFYLTFLDLSQGAISNSWSITGQDGLRFMSNGFSGARIDTLSRQNHIIPDSVVFEKTANIYFQKEGLFTFTWKNVFKDSVGYMNIGSIKDSVTGNWVFTKVFNIQVYGPLISAITILKNNTVTISSSTDTIRLVVGDILTFTDESKGLPTKRTWLIDGGLPDPEDETNSNSDSTYTTIFLTAGTYLDSKLILTREVGTITSLSASLTTKLPVIKVQ